MCSSLFPEISRFPVLHSVLDLVEVDKDTRQSFLSDRTYIVECTSLGDISGFFFVAFLSTGEKYVHREMSLKVTVTSMLDQSKGLPCNYLFHLCYALHPSGDPKVTHSFPLISFLLTTTTIL